MSARENLPHSSVPDASPPGVPGGGVGFEPATLLGEAGMEITVLPPSVQSKGAGTCLWVHDEALSRIQRFRGSVYEDQGVLPMDAMRVGRRYTLSCDSQNFHLVLGEVSGPLVAALRLRFYKPGTTASGLKLFEAVRRMPPAQGVMYTSTINTLVGESRGSGLWVVEISGVALARAYVDHPMVKLLPQAALSLVRSLADALVFAQIFPQMREGSFFDGFEEQIFGLVHADTTRLPAELEAKMNPLRKLLFDTHPHLAQCEAVEAGETLSPLFFQQTGSRPGVGTYR